MRRRQRRHTVGPPPILYRAILQRVSSPLLLSLDPAWQLTQLASPSFLHDYVAPKLSPSPLLPILHCLPQKKGVPSMQAQLSSVLLPIHPVHCKERDEDTGKRGNNDKYISSHCLKRETERWEEGRL